MLLTGLIAGLSGFFVVKLIALINIGILSPEHALTRLWHIAVYEKGKGRMISKDLERMEKVPIEVFNEVKCSCANIFRTISSLFFLLFLVAVMFIAYLSYDIHPIACIRGQADTSILYDGDEENRNGTSWDQSVTSPKKISVSSWDHYYYTCVLDLITTGLLLLLL